MRRAPWVLMLLVLTVAVTVEVVRAQIVFPDGSTQQTAFPGFTQVPVGAAYTRTLFFGSGAASAPITPDLVPVGQELVILKVTGWNTTLCTIESRLPSPNQNTGPITLATIIRSDATNNAMFEMNFPDGAVVVAAGRQPYLNFRSGTNFSVTTAPNAQVITIIGYLRPIS